MRYRHSFFLVLVLSIIEWQPALSQVTYSLQQAVQLAIDHSEEVGIAGLRIEQADHQLEKLKSQRLPSLTMSAGYTWVSEAAALDFQIPGLFSQRISFGDGNVYEAGITAAVPIFTGFRLAHQQTALQSQGVAAREAYRAQRIEISHTVTTLYRNAQLARHSVLVYKKQREALQAQQQLLAAMLSQGQALAYDTLVISARVMAIDVAIAAVESQYQNALLSLSVFLSHEEAFAIDDDTNIDDGFTRAEKTELLREAMEQRPDVRLLTAQAASLRSISDAERADLYPQINATASFRYGKPGVDQIKNDWMSYYTAGLSLQWKLWSWGANKHSIEARDIDVRSIELSEQRLRRHINAGIEALLNDLAVLRANIDLLDMQIGREEQRFQLVSARLREGLANAVEVVDAETSLTTAILDRKKAGIQYAMKVQELAAMIGREL